MLNFLADIFFPAELQTTVNSEWQIGLGNPTG